MALINKNGIFHYDFQYRGHRYQGSTEQRNKKIAKLVEAKVRSDAALEAFGIAPPKVSPFFKEFLEGKFLDYVRDHAKKPGTARFYSEHVTRLLKYKPFAELRLNEVDAQLAAAYRTNDAIATINGDLRTLSKALNLAFTWRLIPRAVKVQCLPGEQGRTFVLDAHLETLYLSLAEYPLREAAILMLDLGLRTGECVALEKDDITHEAVTVRVGKTKNAGRALPQTDRTREAIELLYALWPDSPFLFPGRKGKHFTRKSLDNRHADLRDQYDLPAEFVLYSCRHTFGTKLAESGASPFEIKEAMGHGSITVSQKYIHLSSQHLTTALKRKEAYDKMVRGEMSAEDKKSLQFPE